ncbi:MAG: sulfatase-like hydrolase/transferase [Sedimentisphaeraceae bacterium JB056]
MFLSRRTFFKAAGVSIASTLIGGCQQFTINDKSSAKPNILFILTDDQGWADFSNSFDSRFPQAYCDVFNTPHMNDFLESALRFTDAYASAPICTPTRRSIQFGMTPARQKGTEFIGQFDPSGKWSIAQAIKSADHDYKCAHFGKWGGVFTGTWKDKQSQQPGSPANLGYDEQDGMGCNDEGGIYLDVRIPDKLDRNDICEPFDDPKQMFSLTDKSIDFMRRQSERGNPFYLQLSHYAIHIACQATQRTMDKYENTPQPDRKVVDGIAPMLEDMDTSIGRLLQAVEDLGIADNTYIFFASDNGGKDWHIWDNDNTRKERNHPLRMYKQTLYEGGIRVPFAVKGPGIKKGVCKIPVATYDLFPTFYDIVGGRADVPQELDGTSLVPILKGKSDKDISRPNDGLIFHRPLPPDPKVEGQSAYRQGDYKLMLFWTREGELKRTELYDLSKDIREENDLSDQMPQKVARLKKILLDYLAKI